LIIFLFSTDFSFRPRPDLLAELDGDSDWLIHTWFGSTLIEMEEEYLICDRSCLIGEIGGNLGFFLGGSLFTGFDYILKCFMSIYHKFDKAVKK